MVDNHHHHHHQQQQLLVVHNSRAGFMMAAPVRALVPCTWTSGEQQTWTSQCRINKRFR
jgi:hypothetical protein